jgi:hypothetical protein
MEEALLRALRQGSPEAFAALVAREGPAVYRYLRRMTGNHEDAADLTQEVFVRAYRGLARFEGRSGLFLRRGGCCLNYRLPGREKCDTCCLRPLEERVVLLRRYLAPGERAASSAR